MGEFGASHCNQWGLCCVIVRERRALPKLLCGGLVIFEVKYGSAEATISQIVFM